MKNIKLIFINNNKKKSIILFCLNYYFNQNIICLVFYISLLHLKKDLFYIA